MERHFADQQRILVYLAEYCRGFNPYRYEIVKGVPQAVPGAPLPVLRLMSVMA